jgi:AraC family transcriptional regulator, transcriptional activator of pobA
MNTHTTTVPGHTVQTILPFSIYSIAWLNQNRPGLREHPFHQDRFEITWITKGSGTYIIDQKPYQVNDNTLFCIPPGTMHQLKAHEGTEGFVLSFAGSFLNHREGNYAATLFELFAQSPNLAVEKELANELPGIITKMVSEFENYFLLRSQLLVQYLNILLIYLTRQLDIPLPSPAQNREHMLTRKFLSLLEKHFREKKMVTDYATALTVTPGYLSEVIKKISGHPVSYHIQQRIIQEAKQQATQSHYSMKEIAYSLGFSDTAHFSKFFKNAAGDNFTTFKKTTPSPGIPA